MTLKICLGSFLLNFSLLSFATSNRSHVASHNHSQFASLVSVTSGFPRNSWIFKCDTISSCQRRHKLCLPIIQFGRRQWNWIPPSRNFPNGINIDCATACQRRQTRLNPGKLQTASECFPHGVLVASQPVCVKQIVAPCQSHKLRLLGRIWDVRVITEDEMERDGAEEVG